MEHNEVYQAIFSLMQDDTEVMLNIETIKQSAIDYDKLDISDLDKLDERFYNFLLIFLRNTPDNLWINDEHRIKVYDIIKEQLDAYHPTPTPYLKDKYYS